MTKPDIEAIKARVDATTEGPWEAVRNRYGYDVTETWAVEPKGPSVHNVCHVTVGAEDAEFIAHARSDIPALLAYVEQLEAQIEQADSEVESDIDAYDIRKLRHMLGMRTHIPESEWGYRNYYVAAGNNIAVMERLCKAGFVKHEGGYYYKATRKGVELVGLTGKQLERALGEENGN